MADAMAYWEPKTALMSRTVFFRILIISVLSVGCIESNSLPTTTALILTLFF